MSSATTLSQYLQEQRARFLQDNGRGWTIVMGNEAGDLDTVASSIGYAWHRVQYGVQNDRGKAIALVPTPRVDFVLRPENIHVLALAGITDPFAELLCPEDLPVTQKCIDYALVDHNTLNTRYSQPDARVVAVIDHHEDEGNYRDTASPRIIQPCGSCASLVTSLYMSLSASNGHSQIPSDLAVLLLSAITIDTGGLSKGGKTVDIDRAAVAWLLPYAKVTLPAPIPTETPVDPRASTLGEILENPWIGSLANTLIAEKRSVSHLSTRDLLRRDYKQYTLQLSPSISQGTGGPIQAGLSTVPLPLSTFFKSGSAPVVVMTMAWMGECGLSILGVLTTYRSKKDKGRREQLWIVNQRGEGSGQDRLARALFDGLEAREALLLKRVKYSRYDYSPFSDPFIARVYKQKNTHATRKQVAPILKQIVEG
ncbi:DHH phosphoesterase [Scleroderma citrinum]